MRASRNYPLAANQHAGLARLRAIAGEQAASRTTEALSVLTPDIGPGCADQLRLLEDEMKNAGTAPARTGDNMITTRKAGLFIASILVALGISATATGTAHAATPATVTATTAVSNRPDGGHGSPATWAYDSFTRKLTVTTAADQTLCTSLPAGDTCYTATLTDTGTFDTILGAGTPNGTGGQISHNISGKLAGTGSFVFYAPATDTLTGTVPATEDDNFTDPAASRGSSVWPALAFADPASVVMTPGEQAYSYKYTSTCEAWTDANTNNDGQGAAAGNITGLNFCAVATSNNVQVKDRATGKCLNENKATGLLSTYTCLPQTYISLQWKVVTYSDGTRDLVSVQTGQSVRDNGVNHQLSLTSGQSPMRFQAGGIFRFADSLVIGINNQGNFIPVIGSPSYSSLNNVRWDFGGIPA